MKKVLLLVVSLVAAFGLGVSVSQALVSFGSGYYVNLCDSGTAADYYNCDPGCNPTQGSCRGENEGVVKWTCIGKWDQCLESESDWTNFEEVGNPSCGVTVQLSLFDKKCRRSDGSWDNSCQMLGYMVWYSGDCWPGGTTPGITPTPTGRATVTPTPTRRPTATPRVPAASSTPTPTTGSKISNPTVTPVISRTPTPTPTAVAVCGMACAKASDCKAGFTCNEGVCRNGACPADSTCFCSGGGTAQPVSPRLPRTGVPWFIGVLGMVGLGGLGWKLTRMAKKVW